MTQALVLSGLYVLGLALCLAWGPRRDPALSCALAFPVGVASASLLALASFFFDIGLWAAACGGLALLVAAGWTTGRRWRPGRVQLALLGGCSLVLLGTIFTFSARDATILDYESHVLLLAAKSFASGGSSFDPKLWNLVARGGATPVAAYAVGAPFGINHLYALQPALGVSLVGLVAVVAKRGAEAFGSPVWLTRVCPIVAVGAFVACAGFLYATAHVGHAAFSAAYLAGFIGVWWLAELRGDASATPAALLCLVAFFFSSERSAVLGLAVLASALLPSRLSFRELLVPVGAAVAVLIAGFGAAGQALGDGETFTAEEAREILFGIIAIYLIWVVRGRSHRLRPLRLVPACLAVLAAVAVASGALLNAAGLEEPAAAVWDALREGSWGATWPSLGILTAIALAVRVRPAGELYLVPILLLPLITIWWARDAGESFFQPAVGEVHGLAAQLFPLALLYLLLALARSFGGSEPRVSGLPLDDDRAALGAAAVSLLCALLLANVHQMAFNQVRYGRKYQLSVNESSSMLELSRHPGSTRVRATHWVYYLVAERVQEGDLLVAPELRRHAPYFRHLSRMKVRVGDEPVQLPRRAVEALKRRAVAEGQILCDRTVCDVYFLFEDAGQDYVLATTQGQGPVFWLPRELYVRHGGEP